MNIKTIFFFLSFTTVYLVQAQDTYNSLKSQYDRYRKDKKHDSALVVAKQMNSWALQIETDTSLKYAQSLRFEGNCFDALSNGDSAIFYWNKSLQILKFQKREFTKDYSKTLNQIGIYYWENDNFPLSESFYKKSLFVDSLIYGINSIEYAQKLNNIGVVYEAIGEFDKGDSCYSLVESIFLKVNGLIHTDNIKLYINLGGHYLRVGDYKMAEEAFNKGINIINSLKEKSDLKEETADLYSNLSLVYKHIGDYKSAIGYTKKSIELYESIYGFKDYRLKKPLNNLANYYRIIKSYKEAELVYFRILMIYSEDKKDITNSDYADILYNYGLLKFAHKNFKCSDSLFLKAKIIYENKNKINDPSYAQILHGLGRLYLKISEFNDADKFLNQALDIRKKKFGNNHEFCLSIQRDLANLYQKTAHEHVAYEILNNIFLEKNKLIADNFEWLDDNQKEAYWKKESTFFNNLSSFANEAYDKVPEAVSLNYNAALITKSKMLEAKISSENYYREVDELRQELALRRRLLAKMESDGSAEKAKIEKLNHEADSLDKRLTLSWPEYAQQKKNLSITWDQVHQNLELGEAAIEFVRFKNEDDSLYYYNALVLKKGDKNPTLIKLCKEKELQEINPKMGFSSYYPLVWQPLDLVLKDIKTIYYAPSGDLYNVPFHAIYAPKGKGDEVLAAKTDKRGVVIQKELAATEQNAQYLMDRYTMHQLTSTRYLAMGLKQKAKETIGNTIAMVGGVNYDYLPGSTASPKKNKKDKNANRSSASASGKLNYLEGTKTEVEQINNKVTSATWQTKLIENNEAIEENITKLEGKEAKGILHLATHGYAFAEYDFNDTTINKNSLRYSYRYSVNPMVRSGLILAGGNWAWMGSDTLSKLGAEQNGILTALEVSQLNLKNTKLVVLSACETGLGKIDGSEGTFGLKRGFKLAGVEQMIVSLWSVPDKETMELMTLFYTDLTKTLNPVVSFEKAQKEMRKKYPTEPEKWAGFVLVR